MKGGEKKSKKTRSSFFRAGGFKFKMIYTLLFSYFSYLSRLPFLLPIYSVAEVTSTTTYCSSFSRESWLIEEIKSSCCFISILNESGIPAR